MLIGVFPCSRWFSSCCSPRKEPSRALSGALLRAPWFLRALPRAILEELLWSLCSGLSGWPTEVQSKQNQPPLMAAPNWIPNCAQSCFNMHLFWRVAPCPDVITCKESRVHSQRPRGWTTHKWQGQSLDQHIPRRASPTLRPELWKLGASVASLSCVIPKNGTEKTNPLLEASRRICPDMDGVVCWRPFLKTSWSVVAIALANPLGEKKRYSDVVCPLHRISSMSPIVCCAHLTLMVADILSEVCCGFLVVLVVPATIGWDLSTKLHHALHNVQMWTGVRLNPDAFRALRGGRIQEKLYLVPGNSDEAIWMLHMGLLCCWDPSTADDHHEG